MKEHVLQIGMAPGYLGGTEMFIIKLMKYANENGIIFDFLLDYRADRLYFEKEIEDMGGNIYREYYGLKSHPIKHFWKLYMFFKNHPEIIAVHANMTLVYDIDILIMAKLLNIPIRIMHSHNTNYSTPDLKYKYPITMVLDRLNRKRIHKYANRLFACSRDAGKWMYGENRFSIVPITVDVEHFKFDVKKRRNDREKNDHTNIKIYGMIGRLEYQKNPLLGLKLFSEIHYIDDSALLYIVGEGNLFDNLKEYVDKNHLDKNVFFIRRINMDLMPRFMNYIDAVIMPSRFEGFPTVLVEAQSLGLPCFVSNNITKDVNITGNVYYYNLQENLHETAKSIVSELNKYKRNDQRKTIIDNGYDTEEMAKKMFLVYRGVNIKWKED